jgi:excisionase family DNA binding protein
MDEIEDGGEGGERFGDVERRLAYRPAELAAMVGLSRKAIYRAIERGELRAAKVSNGSRLLIPVSEAEEWLDRSLVEIEPSPSLPSPSRRPRRRSGGLRPLGDAIRELELDSPSGYDRRAI